MLGPPRVKVDISRLNTSALMFSINNTGNHLNVRIMFDWLEIIGKKL